MTTAHFPPGCTLADIERGAAEPEPAPEYTEWAERNPWTAERLERQFMHSKAEGLMTDLLSCLARDGNYREDHAGAIAKRLIREFVDDFESEWAEGKIGRP